MPFSVSPALRALAVVVLTMALAGLHPVAPAGAMPVEGYPSYQPQTTCSPRAKTGTVMLSEWLLRKYPGTSSSGISRGCGSSGISEHKEGRAFDWGLSAESRRDRQYAADFLERLFRTDRRGNEQALARRMGIMYVIWNDHIWSASSGYRQNDYLHSACRKVERCSVTLRHRDHMHISLTWPAARARTSWYLLRGAPAPEPKPKPAPDPQPAPKPKPSPEPVREEIPKRAPRLPDGVIDLRRTPYTRVTVPADGKPVETRFKLRGGATYSLTAAGLYSFGGPDQVGDAVCTWSARDLDWVPKPRRAVQRRYGRLALLVNGKRIFGDSCHGSHTYRTELTPARDRTLKVTVAGSHPSSRGRLTLVVGRQRARVTSALPAYPELTPAPTYSTNPRMGAGLVAETVVVKGSARHATYTRGSLDPGATYRVTVSGLVQLGNGVRSNGQCIAVRGTWYDAASIDPRVPGQDHGNVYVNGTPFRGDGGAAGCGGNSHVGEYVADTRGRMRLDLWDPLDPADNTGQLTVTVQRTTPVGTPVAADRERPRSRRTEWQQKRDVLTVRTDRGRGSVSTMRLRRGERVQVTVSGRFTSGTRTADASCVRTGEGWLPADPDVLGQDLLNLWVDGQEVAWRGSGARGACSSDSTYTTRFTATKNGPLRLAVLDLDHRDNAGELVVRIRRLKG